MIPHYAECKKKQEKPQETLFDGLVSCIHCNRFFLPERVEKHQEICEMLCKKSLILERKRSPKNLETLKGVSANAQNKYTNSKWQKQHQVMIKKLRFDDCPEEYDEYIKCPHCKRSFASIPAAKHIPICKDIIHKLKSLQSKINLLPKLSNKIPLNFVNLLEILTTILLHSILLFYVTSQNLILVAVLLKELGKIMDQ